MINLDLYPVSESKNLSKTVTRSNSHLGLTIPKKSVHSPKREGEDHQFQDVKAILA